MRKLIAIARTETVLRLTDPIMLAFAIAMPLMLAALIHLAFGSLVLTRGIPDKSIPVGIVNQDRGGSWGNFGEVFISAMTPRPGVAALSGDPPFELFAVHVIEDEGQARRMVEREELLAALLIPPDFSETLDNGNATVSVYVNGGDSVRGVAFASAAESLAHVISTVEVTLRTTVKGLMRFPQLRAQLEMGRLNKAIADLALNAARPESNPIALQRVGNAGPAGEIELTHYLAAAIAILFAGFAALAGSAVLLQEKAHGTLQRMYITPTRSGVILGGKALGTYLNGLVQMGVLVMGMAALERLPGGGAGQGSQIDLLGLFMLIPSLVAAATGAGVAFVGLARTYTQAVNYGGMCLFLMGLVGGVFFPVELFPQPLDMLSRLTFHYWAMDGYMKLALGNGAISILPHILVLWAMGLPFFAAGNWLLRRRIGFT